MAINLTLFLEAATADEELLSPLTGKGYALKVQVKEKKIIIPPSCYDANLILFELAPRDFVSLEVIKELIHIHRKPVVLVSHGADPLIHADLWDMGVQDIVNKPWSMAVLDYRIRAALERIGFMEEKNRLLQWRLDGGRLLTLFQDRHVAMLDDRELKLTFSQWNILTTLVGNGGVALSRNYLLRECLHFEQGDTRTLDNHIKNIRKVLGGSSCIDTIHGYGYKLNGGQYRPSK